MEGGFEMPLLAAAGIDAELRRNLAQAADFEEPGQGTRQGVEALIDHERVEFIGEGPGCP